ncbi:hypothetical protein IGB42_02546 [Andreprevotia sp. IGB-42]|uniref:hypothetical protein n=1 Tax=Andreprevotia sp. IGB-42 TaxID=2497473 RepID=UPI00135C8AB3|nr:hypothetical protein [Andreprevotia sp. IGB-42]KAF0813145.1 hypothetical protein IGB42_02546 [Andreprevotia sp. IGB-42]
MTRLFTLLCILFAAVHARADALRQFDFEPDPQAQGNGSRKPVCGFPGLKLPADFAVFAAGSYGGRPLAYQIDQSGHEATQIDVAVNNPGKPVVLMLGAYEPTVWHIGWSGRTNIVAVLVSGYHRQVVAGLEKRVPVLNSSYDNHGPCGYFYVSTDHLEPLNPMAKRVFGRAVDMVYPASKGKVVVGEPLQPGTALLTSAEATPESFKDKNAPLAGQQGVEEAIRNGQLRQATLADADAWVAAVQKNTPKRDIPPVAGEGVPKPLRPATERAYVVLKPFTYPAGLYGANSVTFFILKGVPLPGGNPGHSMVYDFNTARCVGALCERR